MLAAVLAVGARVGVVAERQVRGQLPGVGLLRPLGRGERVLEEGGAERGVRELRVLETPGEPGDDGEARRLDLDTASYIMLIAYIKS